LLLVLATILLAGLGIREWRAGFPDAALRLERFDRAEPSAPLLPVDTTGGESGRTSPRGVNGALTRPETRPVSAAPIVADPRPLDLNRATVAELRGCLAWDRGLLSGSSRSGVAGGASALPRRSARSWGSG